jgi:Cu-Zn family superoxide dismutase
MRTFGFILGGSALLAAGGLSACSTMEDVAEDLDLTDEQSADAAFGTVESRAYATMTNPQGETVGRTMLSWDGEQIQAVADLSAMPAGTYAVHIHTTGRCDPPGYQSADGHWNPTNEGHGFSDIEDGFHKGDLRNVQVGLNGNGQATTYISGVQWTGGMNALFDADGAAVVVHETADDYRTDPAGDAGSRMACGVLQMG